MLFIIFLCIASLFRNREVFFFQFLTLSIVFLCFSYVIIVFLCVGSLLRKRDFLKMSYVVFLCLGPLFRNKEVFFKGTSVFS